MAAPNIVNVSSIAGITTAGALTTSTVSLLSNASNSNKVLKVNSIIISNIRTDGASADVTISYNTAAAGAGTNRKIVFNVTVSNGSTLVALGKDSPIYLEENRSITGSSSTNSSLEWIICYEDISW